MDDLSGKLQELLSDPESMRNLAELAAMLRGGDAQEPAGSGGGQKPEPEGGDLPDLSKLLAVGQVLSSMQQDDNAALLLALRPHLSGERQKRVGRAVRLLQIYRAASVLQENGLLGDLLGGGS